jgi:hypothetical protein
MIEHNLKTIYAIGGNGYCKLIIGGKVDFDNMDVKDKWAAHKAYGNEDIRIKIDTITDILNIHEHIENVELMRDILKLIWSKSVDLLFNGLVKRLNFDESFKISIRTLFWSIKEFVEGIVLLHLKYVHKKNINQLIADYQETVKKNQIDTSSPVLWALFGKSGIDTDIYRDINFTYLGYCPKVYSDRIESILSFPVDKFINEIANTSLDIDLSIFKFKNIEQSLQKLSKIETPIIINCKKIDVDFSSSNNKFMDEFMDAWIQLYDCLYPYFKEQEFKYDSIAIEIDAVNASIKNMSKPLLKLLH